MTIEAQAALAEEFVRGVVRCFGIDATVSSTIDEEHIRVSVDGDAVGYLIGHQGSTIDALQELTRTVVQRRSEEGGGRVNVDVGGYRARRAAALAQFAQKVAHEVIEAGEPQALEPMNAADRKVVHDAVNALDGVSTSSEGDDPHRYVVIHPTPGRAREGSGEAEEGVSAARHGSEESTDEEADAAEPAGSSPDGSDLTAAGDELDDDAH